MFIANKALTIKETKEYRIQEGMIEKLDEMLNEYGINHFFTLPIDSTNGIANNDEDCLTLMYDDEDEMTVDLIYALWCKTVRKASDEKLAECLIKIAAHFIKD